MKTVAAALAAVLIAATPAAAQDIVGPVAAAVDQFGQSMAESMTGGPGVFVTAQGRAPLPDAGALPMTLTIKGEGKTAAEAVAHRNAQLERVRAAANNFDVAIEVGTTSYSISDEEEWAMAAATADATAEAVGAGASAAADPRTARTGTGCPSGPARLRDGAAPRTPACRSAGCRRWCRRTARRGSR
jgi:hypothetical protein